MVGPLDPVREHREEVVVGAGQPVAVPLPRVELEDALVDREVHRRGPRRLRWATVRRGRTGRPLSFSAISVSPRVAGTIGMAAQSAPAPNRPAPTTRPRSAPRARKPIRMMPGDHDDARGDEDRAAASDRLEQEQRGKVGPDEAAEGRDRERAARGLSARESRVGEEPRGERSDAPEDDERRTEEDERGDEAARDDAEGAARRIASLGPRRQSFGDESGERCGAGTRRTAAASRSIPSTRGCGFRSAIRPPAAYPHASASRTTAMTLVHE